MTESRAKSPSLLQMSTALDQALRIVERGVEVAKRDQTTFTNRGLKVSAKGTITWNGKRSTVDNAITQLADQINNEATTQMETATGPVIKRAAGPMTWDSLNQATKDFFFELGEQIQAHTKDHENRACARLGYGAPKISPQNQPRLTNLKKVGVLQTGTQEGQPKTHKFVWLTETGAILWAAEKH